MRYAPRKKYNNNKHQKHIQHEVCHQEKNYNNNNKHQKHIQHEVCHQEKNTEMYAQQTPTTRTEYMLCFSMNNTLW